MAAASCCRCCATGRVHIDGPITRSALSRSDGSRWGRLLATVRNHSSSPGTSSSDIEFSLPCGLIWPRIAGPGPFAGLQYKSIAPLLNFEESGAVLLPLLGRCSRPPRPKSFEEFIHLGPRQIHDVCAIRGGIEIPYHDDHSLAAGDPHDGSSDRNKAGAAPKPARRRIRVTSEQTPRPASGSWPAFPFTPEPLEAL